MGSVYIEVDFYNTYIIRKVATSYQPYNTSNSFGGFGTIYAYPGIATPGVCDDGLNVTYSSTKNWFAEEARIRGGFNNTITDLGVRAYLDEEFPDQQRRINTLIYSGVYNSRTGINQTNVFSVGDTLTRSADPIYGSIQKTYAEDTNLIVFQENKVSRALIDKDTIYTTEGGTQTQAGSAVLGQIIPYKGDYGISKNPESFAIYSYRKYFSDKSRNAVMRLSNDGLTEISMYGMRDYFRDNLAQVSNNNTLQSVQRTKVSGGLNGEISVVVNLSGISPGMSIDGYPGHVTYVDGSTIYYSQTFGSDLPSTISFQFNTRGKIIGGWDIHNKNYVISLQKNSNQVSSDTAEVNTLEDSSNTYATLAFDEDINGWVSFFTYKPNLMFSVLNRFYSIDNYLLYKHYDTALNNRGLFYGVRKPSNVTFVLNPQPDVMKNFKTINYEGSNGWEVTSFKSGFTGFDTNPAGAGYIQSQDTTSTVKSYNEGLYTDSVTGQPLRAGFDRKENRYVANLISSSIAAPGEILFGSSMTGIKGYFSTVTIETDDTTQLGGAKELWAAGSEFVLSSM